MERAGVRLAVKCMSEFQNPPGLSLQSLPRLPLATIGVLLVAGVLGAVALGVSWNDFDVSGTTPSAFGFGGGSYHFEGAYSAFEVSFAGQEEPYSSGELDDAEGIGLLRTGGPLLAVGMSLAFVALVLVVLDLFVPDRHLDTVAVGTAGLAFLVLLAGIITLSAGIDRSLDDSFGGAADAGWGVGFFLAIAAGALALAGTATGLVYKLRSGA